ncbi:hypothetical protein BDV37DRAFT_263442 [Aspergillus pseudonomiae]|uniref:Uncharacterized protein n=1 Tax=Aspergillus pseudonomiae TaxID=1506151 RepID=A0A5N7CW17_9EURO|nr:uncharacterized protein BDV37DRAFT_263442 [Aspergillus pseudonomiae]KAE8398370.1 hypothetical protein BDV37DRAFT_263442 [Aspergillus pseudonomiae]
MVLVVFVTWKFLLYNIMAIYCYSYILRLRYYILKLVYNTLISRIEHTSLSLCLSLHSVQIIIK